MNTWLVEFYHYMAGSVDTAESGHKEHVTTTFESTITDIVFQASSGKLVLLISQALYKLFWGV